MTDEINDIMGSLTMIMREETERLQQRERVPGLAALAAAKARLIGALEELLARSERVAPRWAERLAGEERERLFGGLAELREASQVNASMLERQIRLSRDMITAITEEAMRLSSSRALIYGSCGNMAGKDLTTPISFNSEY